MPRFASPPSVTILALATALAAWSALAADAPVPRRIASGLHEGHAFGPRIRTDGHWVAYGVRESVKGTFKTSYYARSLVEDGVFRSVWPNAHPSLEAGEGTASFTDLVGFQWHPDGQHNAMVALHKSRAEELLLESMKVRLGGDGAQRTPAIAPDGTRLVAVGDGGGGTNLWVADTVDGATPLQLTFTPETEDHPSWHPKDAKVIYEVRNRLGSDIALFDLDTFASSSLFRNGVSDEVWPTFSPTGKDFAFLSNKDSADGLSFDLFVTQPGGALPIKVASRVRRSEHGPGYAWDPMGRYLFVVTEDEKAGHPLCITPADGSSPPRPLAFGTKDNLDPTVVGLGASLRLLWVALDVPRQGVTPYRIVYVVDLDVTALSELARAP